MPTIEWNDLSAMLADIHAHVRTTGRKVEIADEPHRLRFGFRDRETEKVWFIRLAAVRHASTDRELLTQMATTESRLRVANAPLSV